MLEEALVTADEHTERFYAAELHRLKGELVLRKCLEAGVKPAPGAIYKGHVAERGDQPVASPD